MYEPKSLDSVVAQREREQKLLAASKPPEPYLGRIRVRHDLDNRPAQPNHKPSNPRNNLMFFPESIEDFYQTPAQLAEMRSLAPPKATIAANTRFPPAPLGPEVAVPPSPTLSAIDDAIAGRPRPTASETGHDGSETPRVNGYAFVDAEPTPSELGNRKGNDEIDTTALLARLPKSQGPNHFKIQQQSKREELHHRMVDKQNAAKRDGTANSKPVAAGPGTGTRSFSGIFGGTPGFGGYGTPAPRTPMTPGLARLHANVSSAPPVEEPLVNWSLTRKARKYERKLPPGLTPKKKPEEEKKKPEEEKKKKE